MLVFWTDSVHYHLNNFHDQILRLSFGDVGLAEVENGFDPLYLHGLFAEHEHPASKWEDVDGYDIDDLILWDEDSSLKHLLEKLVKALKQF